MLRIGQPSGHVQKGSGVLSERKVRCARNQKHESMTLAFHSATIHEG